ncbi:MAG: DUF460 domain-containing protein [Pyrobaculum sp.]
MAILGLDVAPGGFAYAVLENNVVVERGVAEVRDVLRLFKKYKCSVLAVDNVGELFQYGRLVVKALGKLPYVVDVVEVTRGGDGYRSVEELVREHFGVNKGRLDPLETASYLAMLAWRGVGASVKLYEEETVVLVHRRISTTPGGMSRNRYMRNISLRIKDMASKIENKLKEARLDYDLFIKEESGEITSAKFVVYASREVVRRYVKPLRSIDVAVSIYSTPAKARGAPAHSKFLIVGVDPGVVTGLAIITLDGEVLDTVARRSFSRGDLVRYVSQWGVPILVATDVSEPPEYVKKLAAMSGAALYVPERDLTTEDKTQLVERAGWAAKSTHERDALAAAYKAYLEYKPKFEKIEKEFGGILKPDQLEYAKSLVVRGYSIAHAVSEALKKKESRETKVVYITVEKPCAPVNEEVKSRIKALEYENTQLQKELEEVKREYLRLQRLVEDERWKDLKYRELQSRVETLARLVAEKEEEIARLKKLVLDILTNYGSKYKLLHVSEALECKGDEPAGTICKNVETIDEAVAKKTLGVPLKLVSVLSIDDFYIIDVDKVQSLVREIKNRLDATKGVDLKKILQQYRRGLV